MSRWQLVCMQFVQWSLLTNRRLQHKSAYRVPIKFIYDTFLEDIEYMYAQY